MGGVGCLVTQHMKYGGASKAINNNVTKVRERLEYRKQEKSETIDANQNYSGPKFGKIMKFIYAKKIGSGSLLLEA